MQLGSTIHTRAPGRVNLIGDHTDYTGGLCLPMAIDRAIEVVGTVVDGPVRLASAGERDAVVPLDIGDPARLDPEWARYVAGVVHELRPRRGFTGTVTTTVPTAAGLSSSAALEVAVALALGADATDVVALARLCQRAEHLARGVPTGLLDQLAVIGGVEGHAILLDCASLTLTPVALPAATDAEWVVIHVSSRSLSDSGYGARVAELADAEAAIGPLRLAGLGDVDAIDDPVVRARARHVVTENARVREFTAAIASGDLALAGAVMNTSHASLRDDFDNSTALIDELCSGLTRRPGVYGARITGAGWGGCIVALAEPGAIDIDSYPRAWSVRPSSGASRLA